MKGSTDVPNNSFEVTVIDQWPNIKLLVKQGVGVRDEGPVQYDIAATQFEPAVKDALRKAVDNIIQIRKGR